VFSRSIEYGGECNVVVSVRWEPRQDRGGHSHELEHLYKGMNMDFLFHDLDLNVSKGVGGEVGRAAACKRREVVIQKPVVAKKPVVVQKSPEKYPVRIPKLSFNPSGLGFSPRKKGSGVGVESAALARRQLDAKAKQRQVAYLNRRALQSRVSGRSGVVGNPVVVGSRSVPSGRLMKKEEMQWRNRERMRNENRSSLGFGKDMRRRPAQKGQRSRLARD